MSLMMHFLESMGKGVFGGATNAGKSAVGGWRFWDLFTHEGRETLRTRRQLDALKPKPSWSNQLNTKAGGWWDENVTHYLNGGHLSEDVRNTAFGKFLRGFDGTVGAAARGVGSAAGLTVHGATSALWSPFSAVAGAVARPAWRTTKAAAKAGAKGTYSFVTDKNMWRGMKYDIQSMTGGKGLVWGTRKSTFVGLGLTAGFVGIGGAWSGARAFSDLSLGEALPVDEYAETFLSPQEMPTNIKHRAPGQMINDYSATGDLVFALNNRRNGGIL